MEHIKTDYDARFVKICSCCGNPITSLDYYASNDCNLCKSCGEDELQYVGELENYIRNDDVRESYMDDEITDIEMFEKTELTKEETQDLINELKYQITYKDARIRGLNVSIKRDEQNYIKIRRITNEC